MLDLKVDPAKAVIPKPGMYRASTKSIGDPAGIQALADLIVQAKPAILLGQQVWTCRGTGIAREFVEKLNIPTYMNGAGRGTLGPDHPVELPVDAARCVRRRRPHHHRRDAVRLPFRLRQERTLEDVVQIDMSYATVSKNRDISLGLVGDVGAILGRGAASHDGEQRQRRGVAQGMGRIAARQRKTRPLKRACPN